jgi:hypothetical protein
MNTQITPEALIEMGFEQLEHEFVLNMPNLSIYVINKLVYIDNSYNGFATNASTIEDIKDLIRLFK